MVKGKSKQKLKQSGGTQLKKKLVKEAQTSFHSSPINDFLTPFKPAPNQWIVKHIVIIFAIIIRCAVSIGSYSGELTPPMYGDFEAQRHWLEITQHLPLNKWYFYDLQYWGLDYPPLTLYHSYVLGKIGSVVNSLWFALDSSRGYETSDLKTFMRITSLLSEIFILFPATLQYIKHIKGGKSPIDQVVILGLILFQPCLILIDHGHFQYNSVMLGLFLASVNCLLSDKVMLLSFYFVLSIGFKQMALYYAPFIFSYLLLTCVNKGFKIDFWRLFKIGISVVITFILLLLPFVLQQDPLGQLKQVLIRVFPFNRGIFEDKVGNFWCSTNIFIKYKNLFTNEQLQRLSLLLTVIGFAPSCFVIFLRPQKQLIILGFICTSLSFFLFSFQVHEKTILVPLLPTLLIFDRYNSLVSWFSNFALFSLYPLLAKDHLHFQYFIMGLLFNWLIGNLNFISKVLPNFIIPGPTLSKKLNKNSTSLLLPNSIVWRIVIIGSYLIAGAVHVLDFFVESPSRYPDLWVIANTTLSFAVFSIFFLWCNFEMIKTAFWSTEA